MTQSPPRVSLSILTSIPTDCPQDTQKIQHLRFLPSGNALLSGTCDSLRVLVWDPTPCVVANVCHAHHTVSVLESRSSVAWLVCACLLQLDAPWGRLADMQLCNDTKLVSASLDGTYVREWGVDVKVGAPPLLCRTQKQTCSPRALLLTFTESGAILVWRRRLGCSRCSGGCSSIHWCLARTGIAGWLAAAASWCHTHGQRAQCVSCRYQLATTSSADAESQSLPWAPWRGTLRRQPPPHTAHASTLAHCGPPAAPALARRRF